MIFSVVSATEKMNSGEKKPSEVVIERKRNNHFLKYKVVDSTLNFTEQDWKRVVAVFASGTNWQFKDWIWPTPVEVFTHLKGFHIKYDDEPVPDSIKSWSVKVLNVSKSKSKGHISVTAATQFWDSVDKHLLLKKNSKDLFHSHYYS
jgi:parafibromin